jgi:predicted transcriptional regulator
VNTDEFYKLPKSLAMADGYVSKKTGEAVKLTASGKIIYAYMLSKNEFFTETLKGQHYEAQATIAKCCGIEYKAAGTILRSFLDHGVMEGKKLKPDSGQWRWFYYKVHSDLVLWEGSVQDFQLIEEEKPEYAEKVVSKPTITHKPYQHQPEPEWDDSQLPF